MERITMKKLQALADEINARTGKQPNQKGHIVIYGAYGAYAVHSIWQDNSTAEKDLTGLQTARECWAYLQGRA